MSDTSGITAEQLAHIVLSINSSPALELGLAEAFPSAKFKISGTLISMSHLNCYSYSLISIDLVFLFFFLFHHKISNFFRSFFYTFIFYFEYSRIGFLILFFVSFIFMYMKDFK